MPNQLRKLGITRYVPGVPAVQGHPAYCVALPAAPSATAQSKQPKSAWTNAFSSVPAPVYGGGNTAPSNSNVRVVPVTDPFTGQVTGYEALVNGLSGGQPSEISGGQSGGFGSEFNEYYSGGGQECFPAVIGSPGSPARLETTPLTGWTGGASSTTILAGNVLASFLVNPAPLGVICGLAPTDITAAFNEATHAFYAQGATLRVVELGVIKATVTGVDLSTQPRMYILRTDARVTYHVGDWMYVSEVQSVGAVVLDASLYTTGDYVDSPEFEALTFGNMPAVAQTASFDWSLPLIDGHFGIASIAFNWVLPSLFADFNAEQTGLNGFAWELPSIDVLMGRATAQLEGILPALFFEATAGFPIIETAGFNWLIPPFLPEFIVKVGSIASFDWDIPMLQLLSADRPYASLSGTLGNLFAYFDEGPPSGEYGVMEPILAVDFFRPDPTLIAVFYDRLEVRSTATFILMLGDTFLDGVLLSDQLTVSQVLQALFNEGLAINSSTSNASHEALQYAVNLATGAVGTYQNFDFQGFVRVGQSTYGWRADGLYEIGGSDDDGDLINALLDLGKLDLDTLTKTRCEGAFIGLSTDGTAYVRVVEDSGQEWLYEIEQHPDRARAKFGRGLRSREFSVSLRVIDASAIDLQSIEFVSFTAVRSRRQ